MTVFAGRVDKHAAVVVGERVGDVDSNSDRPKLIHLGGVGVRNISNLQ